MKLGKFISDQRLTPTLEGILFQTDDAFTSALQTNITKFCELVSSPGGQKAAESDTVLKDEFRSLIKDRFGIKCSLHTTSLKAAAIANVYVKHSPMVRSYLAEVLETKSDSLGQAQLSILPSLSGIGTVNIDTVKLGGWFSEQTVPIFLNFYDLSISDGLTPAEIVGITLHEVGHIFEGAASCNRINSTNQIISDVVKRISGTKAATDSEYVYHELKKIDSEVSRDTVDGLMSGNSVVMGTSAFRLLVGVSSSLSGSSIYDNTSFEASADSFAVRFGYAAELASGMDKTKSSYLLSESFSELMKVLVVAVITVSTISLIKTMFAGAVTGMLLLTVARNALIAGSLIYNNRLSTKDYKYDETVDRLDRIRRNVIEQLKIAEMPAADKKDVLLQLQSIDLIRKNAVNPPRFLKELSKLVFSSDRRNQRSIDAQIAVEKLIANDIFVSSAKLSVLKA